NPTLEADVDATNSQTVAVGVATRIQSNGDAYVAVLTHAKTAEIWLINTVKETSSVLASAPAPGGITAGTLRFDVADGATPQLTLSLNGTQLLQITPNGGDVLPSAGGIGIFASGPFAIIDNLGFTGS